MIVMKFGGTSNQDARAIANVVQIVESHRDSKPIVVISAVAQATNMLERIARRASEGTSGKACDAISEFFEKHYTIADDLIKNDERRTEMHRTLQAARAEMEELVKGVEILRELTARTLDAFYSFGELLSSRLVVAGMQEHGIAAQWLDTQEFMITDENHNAALPNMDVVRERLNKLVVPVLKRNVIPVTQGFIGATPKGLRTTMGRESSDYSASIIGAALHSEEIQIWTDVDGILTSDPRVVSSPKKINSMSFEEALELSYFGAKVLHPNTMLPAMEMNIPIRILNSRRPRLTGTRITSESFVGKPLVKSIAYKLNISLVTISPKQRYGQYIFWEHIYSILTKFRATANLSTTSEYKISFTLDTTDNLPAIVHALEEVGVGRVVNGRGIVCLVGENIGETPGFLEKIFHSTSGCPVELISFGASNSSLSLVMDEQEVPNEVRKLHAEFFESSDSEEFETGSHDH